MEAKHNILVILGCWPSSADAVEVNQEMLASIIRQLTNPVGEDKPQYAKEVIAGIVWNLEMYDWMSNALCIALTSWNQKRTEDPLSLADDLHTNMVRILDQKLKHQKEKIKEKKEKLLALRSRVEKGTNDPSDKQRIADLDQEVKVFERERVEMKKPLQYLLHQSLQRTPTKDSSSS